VRVTTQFLAKGVWYALEQCGLLLGDAVDRFDNGRTGTALGLAMHAREEYGKARILLDLHDQAQAGHPIELEEVRGKCEDHGDKQRAAQSSVTMSAPADSQLAKLMQRQWQNPSSPEADSARDEMGKLTKGIARRTPDDRQKLREGALYVDPDDSGTGWSRPAECPRDLALREIHNIANDYAVFCGNLNVDDRYKALHATLDGWAERPQLPGPSRPKCP
jgi:AbiV family abortive infection protein